MKFQSVRLEPSIRQCLQDPALQPVLPALIAGGME